MQMGKMKFICSD